MADPDVARQNQLRNIQTRTGKTIVELHEALAASGLTKVGQQRTLLMEQFALGYGDANMVALFFGKPLPVLDGPATVTPQGPANDPLVEIYSGAKAKLMPLHAAVLDMVRGIGAFEASPKKSYISLRRRKQFAMLGPATKDLIEIGLNAKALSPAARLKAMPAGGMCQYTVRIGSVAEIDQELQGWLRTAFDQAG
ncbi:MAG: DUF4287 domain-containing protein [Rhodoferax sp.]|jgi:hypothetical protein|uniref:DUF5655 domain-containing protein n=1 Tax=Rhodoferax sp. TaxID=50421 RepID=UPI001B49F4B9|nr:DUF5655 domain-containing protein [Rhodoferax sp.]MBP9149146.1 DUF4287 domain-containing protein [Rhodoferax sp.]MBP9737033.1 DUF4287 domain-containing protein [Rhodoferax sp.]